VTHDQIVMIDLGSTSATIASWNTDRYKVPTDGADGQTYAGIASNLHAEIPSVTGMFLQRRSPVLCAFRADRDVLAVGPGHCSSRRSVPYVPAVCYTTPLG
jgi:hypothetical protein